VNESQANTWLVKYEESNSDLSKRTRRILGLFALAANRKVPRKVVDDILGYESAVFHRDISRRWWLILYHSGVGKHWAHFAHLAQVEGLPDAWRWLSKRLTKKKRSLALQRLGSVPWRASRKWRQQHHGGRGTQIRWFKMGTWYNSSAWTRLLIDGKSLDSRRRYIRPIHEKIRPYVRLLERECYHRINPDKVTPPQAMRSTVTYVRRRLKEIVRRPVSLETVAWFLTVDVPKRISHIRPRCSGGLEVIAGTRRLLRMWR